MKALLKDGKRVAATAVLSTGIIVMSVIPGFSGSIMLAVGNAVSAFLV